MAGSLTPPAARRPIQRVKSSPGVRSLVSVYARCSRSRAQSRGVVGARDDGRIRRRRVASTEWQTANEALLGAVLAWWVVAVFGCASGTRGSAYASKPSQGADARGTKVAYAPIRSQPHDFGDKARPGEGGRATASLPGHLRAPAAVVGGPGQGSCVACLDAGRGRRALRTHRVGR